MDELMAVAGILAIVVATKVGVLASKAVTTFALIIVQLEKTEENKEFGPWARRRWNYSLSSTHKSQQGQRT